MKKLWSLTLVATLVGAAFLAGVWVTWHASGRGQTQGARKVLYWVDPMHPSYKSDKPGIAPDCGMQLEPVYADEPLPATGSPIPPGSVRIPLDRQQIIGVRVGRVERSPASRTISTIGRVAVDETRIYRLTTSAEGRVSRLSPVSSGSLVQKDDVLVYFTSRDILTAEQSFFYGLWAVERYKKEGAEGPDQMKIAEGQVKSGADALANYGMSQRQIEELRQTRTPTSDIEIRSPVTGYVLSRTVFPNQRYETGTELFRVADLSHVWVLADVFTNDAPSITPGMSVRVAMPSAARADLPGRVSNALPTFDVASRTFKVRVEVDNPGYVLRPDMFVDVQFTIALPPALGVPIEAIIDSGSRKTVFVDRGNGFFEPRTVETGWRVGDRIQIVSGLMEGEAIVVSGNFLLDSEARMRAAATGVDRSTSQIDPVCGMEVDPAHARTAGRTATYGGTTYYFCSDKCKEQFSRAPAKYAKTPVPTGEPRGAPGSAMPKPGTPAPVSAQPHSAAPAQTASGSAAPQPPPAPPAGPVGAPSMSQPWPGARVGDGQYTPKNKLLRRPARGGSPMQIATPEMLGAQTQTGTWTDPVCGMSVDLEDATRADLKSEYEGKTYYFCSDVCKKAFEKDPARYARK